MPLYEYRCTHCNSRYEKLVRHSSVATEVQCPSCGKDDQKPELSTFAARSGSSASPAPTGGGCPSGMCRTPDVCGRN